MTTRKLPKSLISMFSVLAITASTLLPAQNVFADAAATYSGEIKFADEVIINQKAPKITLTFKDSGNQAIGEPIVAEINKENPTAEIEEEEIPATAKWLYFKVDDAGLTLGKNALSLKIGDTEFVTSSTRNKVLGIGKGNAEGLKVDLEDGKYHDKNIVAKVTFGETPAYTWDGDSVYFVWTKDGSDTLFYHKITGIDGEEPMTIDVEDIVDDTDSTKSFSLKNQTLSTGKKAYEFVWTSGLTAALTDNDFTGLTPVKKMEYLRTHGMAVDPVGSNPASENSIHTAGDHNFSLTIANKNKYQPVTITTSKSKYQTEFDNELISAETKDISGSTLANPVVIKTFLLENSIKLSGNNIKSISVANSVIPGATSLPGYENQWTVTFTSNFFDEVVLRIEYKDGTEGFVQIVRKDMQIVRFQNDQTTNYAEVIYDSNKSHTNYQVLLTGVTADSKETVVIANANNALQDALGNTATGYEIAPTGTKGIKKAWYKLPDLSKYSKIYLTVVNKQTSDRAYAGTLQGHGNGIPFVLSGGGWKRVLENGNLEN